VDVDTSHRKLIVTFTPSFSRNGLTNYYTGTDQAFNVFNPVNVACRDIGVDSMVKADFTRDYYGDLEIQPTADLAEIKKQFKKLGMFHSPHFTFVLSKTLLWGCKIQLLKSFERFGEVG
jgi:hypothetical protein